MTTLFTILFDGVAYGMLLFVLACGLAVTLGLMNFVNLAHGAFAMTGGYVCAVLVNNSGWPFFAALPLAFVASAAIGAVLERGLYRHLYTRSHLERTFIVLCERAGVPMPDVNVWIAGVLVDAVWRDRSGTISPIPPALS